MASRSINSKEKYLLANYQHLMPPADRMVAEYLVAANFDLDEIPRSIWKRVWLDLPGTDRRDPWKLPIQICLRLLKNHKSEITISHDV